MPGRTKARWPEFFIVGAPRCGTSFLGQALRSHPSVFTPHVPEPLYFCSDLNTGTAADERHFIRSAREYLALFAPAPASSLVGEGCVYNLFSEIAAQRIHDVRPDARIIISLREPVSQMVSFHAIRLAEGQEELPFAAALAAEPDRLRGMRLPVNAVVVPAYAYRAVASYSGQVERYLRLFPRDQVLVLIYEDLRRDPAAWLTTALRFLGLELGRVPTPGVVNAAWRTRSSRLATLTRSPTAIGTAKRALPRPFHPLARRFVETIARINRHQASPPSVDPRLRQRLREELAPDVERLERLLDMDLSPRWQYRDRAAGAAGHA